MECRGLYLNFGLFWNANNSTYSIEHATPGAGPAPLEFHQQYIRILWNVLGTGCRGAQCWAFLSFFPPESVCAEGYSRHTDAYLAGQQGTAACGTKKDLNQGVTRIRSNAAVLSEMLTHIRFSSGASNNDTCRYRYFFPNPGHTNSEGQKFRGVMMDAYTGVTELSERHVDNRVSLH
jgi:hypothetical protein